MSTRTTDIDEAQKLDLVASTGCEIGSSKSGEQQLVTAHNPRNYRADIDGIRGLAVLSVITFHLNSKILPTGYTGVDFFFVISGFLISGIILNDIQNSSFRLVDFYSKRVRRIFPCL